MTQASTIALGDNEPGAEIRHSSGRRPFIIQAAALVALTIAVYLPSFSSRFLTYDDYQYVVDNKLVRFPALHTIGQFFKEVTHPSTVAGYYQPLTMISLMLDAWLEGDAGRDPLIYHATNILLHAVNVVLVLWIMRRLVGGTIGPLLAATLFALHPAQVESVAWISQRKTVLASMFAFASIAFYLNHGGSRRLRYLVAALFCYLLGGLAKPTLMLLPLAFILLDYWPLRRPLIRSLPEKLPMILLMVAMGTVAWISQMTSASLGVPKLGMERMIRWIGLLSYNLVLYLGNLVWPMHLSPFRAIPTDLSLANPVILFSLLGAVGFGLSVITSARWSKSYFTGMLGFLLLLLPALGGVQFYGSCVSDRFLYLPMVFALVPLAVLIQTLTNSALRSKTLANDPRVGRLRNLIYGVFLLAIPMIILTRSQQIVWRNSRNFWFHVQAAVPDLAKANRHVALFYHDDGNFEKCLIYATKAHERDPDNPQNLHLLARALTRTGSPQRAIKLIRRALDIGLGPKQGWGYISLAEAYLAIGNIKSARRALRKAVTLGRGDAKSLAMLGNVALDYARRCEWAIDFYSQALQKSPDDLEIRFRLAKALSSCRRHQDALNEYQTIIDQARRRNLRYPKVESEMKKLRESMQSSTQRSR